MEKERNLDSSAAIADMRFAYIGRVSKECVKKPHESKERIRSEKIDKILSSLGSFLLFSLFRGMFLKNEIADNAIPPINMKILSKIVSPV